jgi:hypothetical protein
MKLEHRTSRKFYEQIVLLHLKKKFTFDVEIKTKTHSSYITSIFFHF